jgi:hypothetical protein
VKHGEVVLSQLLIASSNPPVLLEPVDAALYQVALAVSLLVKRTAAALIFSPRDGVAYPPPPQVAADALAAVAFVTNHALRSLARTTNIRAPDGSLFHQLLKHHRLVALSCGDQQAKRFAPSLST